jgi:hypothetical protein
VACQSSSAWVAQQPYLGVDLGGQLDEGHGGMGSIQLECGAGGVQPLGGPGGALVAVGGLVDAPGQPGRASCQQGVGSPPVASSTARSAMPSSLVSGLQAVAGGPGP